MSRHEVWHVVVLGTTLLGLAGLVLLALASVAGGEAPPGLRRARPAVVGVAAAAAILLAWEWLVVH